ncbi:MAG TPA: hypothetical protein DFR83_22155 [Deltaproteobacteria bacterium]|nr:hypothetical protein [Deltaproteobacteria bacterium]
MRSNILSILILVLVNAGFFGWLAWQQPRDARRRPKGASNPAGGAAGVVADAARTRRGRGRKDRGAPAEPRGGAAVRAEPISSAPTKRLGMFPMAGMPDYTGGAEEACPTLQRLLDIMDAEIRQAGGDPPLMGERRDWLLSGSCSLEDPELAAMMGVYRDTYGLNGLRPLPPFSYFGSPADVSILGGLRPGLEAPSVERASETP